jgi:hypothetical protein
MQEEGIRPRRFRVLTWFAIASLVALFVLGSTGSAALAVGTTLNQTPPISWDAVAFQGDEEECAAADVAPGSVLWHFVLTQTSAASGTLTATFASGVVVQPSSFKTGNTLHFFITTGQTTLLAASTDVTGRNLNLSHICSGDEITTTTTTTTTTTN